MRGITNLTEAFDALNKIDRPARRRIRESKSNSDEISRLMDSIRSNIDSEDFQSAMKECDNLKGLIYQLSKKPTRVLNIMINFIDSDEVNKINKEEYIENILKESGLSPDKYNISYIADQNPQMYAYVILDYFDDETSHIIRDNLYMYAHSIIDSIRFKENN